MSSYVAPSATRTHARAKTLSSTIAIFGRPCTVHALHSEPYQASSTHVRMRMRLSGARAPGIISCLFLDSKQDRDRADRPCSDARGCAASARASDILPSFPLVCVLNKGFSSNAIVVFFHQ